jgi:hypothetical protein
MSSGFCRHPKAAVGFTAHNGKEFDSTPVVASSCPRSKKHHKKGAHKHHRAS